MKASSTPAGLYVALARHDITFRSCQRCRPLLLPASETIGYVSFSRRSQSTKSRSTALPSRAETTPATTKWDPRINPPVSTLPAPVEVPKRAPDQKFISWAYSAGKAYWGFYKTGVKNIFANRRLAKEVQQRLLKQQRAATTASPAETLLHNVENVSRAEFQLLDRSSHDTFRIPIFGFLFLICGEYLPLIVIFFTPLVPYTCRIPHQVEKSRRKIEEQRKRSFRGELGGKVPEPSLKAVESGASSTAALDGVQLLHISRSLGLHSRFWDTAMPGYYPPPSLARRKVQRRLEYLDRDDSLLLRDAPASAKATGSQHKAAAQALSPSEVTIACEHRGIDVLGEKETKLRETLERWLKGRRAGSSAVLKMLLSRPNVW